MKRIPAILSLFWIAFSCVYPYDIPEAGEETPYLVVDGSIVVGKEATLTLRHLNQSSRYLPDEWWVEDNTGVQYRPAQVKDAADLSKAPVDRSYRMVIKADGKTYSTSLEKGMAPPRLDEISFVADNSNVYVNVSLTEGEGGAGHVALSFEEVWRFHTLFMDFYEVQNIDDKWYVLERQDPDTTRYRCWRYAHTSKEVLVDLTNLNGTAKDFPLTSFSRKSEKNHENYNIKVSARSLSDAEYRFQKNIQTSVGGYNLFSPNPGEIAGNVRCEEEPTVPVMGYVTLSLASSREAHLDGRYFIYTKIDKEGYDVPTQDQIPFYYLELVYRPLFEEGNEDGETTSIYWGPLRCVDCVADGGSLEKPSFK